MQTGQVLTGAVDGRGDVLLGPHGDGGDGLARVGVVDREVVVAVVEGASEQEAGGLPPVERRAVDRHRSNPISSWADVAQIIPAGTLA